MRKTVLLIRNTSPENYGGAEFYQIELAKLLEKHNFSPIIVSSSEKLLKVAKKNNFKTIKAPFNKAQNWSGFRNFLLPVYFLWELKLKSWYKNLFKNYNPSVINIQSRDDWLAATPIAKKLGIKVFWTDHMDFRSWVLTNVDKKYKNPIGKKLLKTAKKADKIIMISDFEADYFKQQTAPKTFPNLVIIKNGVEDFYSGYKNIKPVPNSFCYIGRLVDYKGINELFSAFKNILKDFPSATLNLYGSGKIPVEKNPNIIFHGFTNEPLKALAKNEIFVLPSYREGLSLSLLDAAMMEKTIIASNVDGNPEVVIDKKTGLLVHAKDANALELAMRNLLNNPDLKKSLAKTARTYYEKNFNFSKIFEEKMLPLYSSRHILTNSPLISLIVPVYNVETYLSSCLDSILNQSYKNLEIILVNDGSTDSSRLICEEYKLKDSRIKLINQKNQGLSSARNTGLKAATGEYLSFVDSDDWLEETFIESLYLSLEKSNSDISVCGYNKILPEKKVLSGKNATIRLLTEQENLDVLTWNKLYKKDLFIKNNIRYPVGKVHEDNLTTYKLYSKAKKVSFLNESLYHYRERKGSIMSQEKKELNLESKETAALEALDYFKNDKTLTSAAEISLLLSKFAWLDNIISKKVDKRVEPEILSWLKSNRKKFIKNRFITKKLKTYLFLITNFNGALYKLFRKIKH